MVSKCGDGEKKDWKMADVYLQAETNATQRRFDKIVDYDTGCEMMALLVSYPDPKKVN
jgi:hypothetical protein